MVVLSSKRIMGWCVDESKSCPLEKGNKCVFDLTLFDIPGYSHSWTDFF